MMVQNKYRCILDTFQQTTNSDPPTLIQNRFNNEYLLHWKNIYRKIVLGDANLQTICIDRNFGKRPNILKPHARQEETDE